MVMAFSINGTVYNHQATAYSGATVTCSNASFSNTTVTSAIGFYRLDGYVKAGNYDCLANATDTDNPLTLQYNGSLVVAIAGADKTDQDITMSVVTVPDYSGDDTGTVLIDLMVTIIVAIVGLAGIIAIVYFFGYASKRTRGIVK